MNKAVKKHKSFRLSENVINQLETYASENNILISEALSQIIESFFSSQINDTALLLYRYEEVNRSLNKLDRKFEELGHLFIDWLIMYFRIYPEMSEGDDGRSLDRGYEKTIQFLTAHRNKMKENKPFLQAIYGDLLEEDNSFDEEIDDDA